MMMRMRTKYVLTFSHVLTRSHQHSHYIYAGHNHHSHILTNLSIYARARE